MYQVIGVTIKEVDTTNNILEAIFSTADEDRHGDIVMQNWDLKSFKKNPVILNSHNYGDATEVIGKTLKIGVSDGQLAGKIQFAVNENPKAKIIFDLYAGGFLNAFSVGFIPKEFDDKGKILKSELLEVSAVSVPANAYALAKQKGIDVDKLYDDGAEDDKSNKDGDGEEGDEGDGSGEGEGGEGGKKVIKPAGGQEPKIKEFENWDESGVEIRYKLRDIAEFEPGTFQKVLLFAELPRIKAIVGVLKGDNKNSIQCLFFPKEDGWTVDDARKWFTMWQFQLLQGELNDLNKSIVVKEAGKKTEEKKAPEALSSAISRVVVKEAGKKTEVLSKINRAINDLTLIGEQEKVETRRNSGRAEDKKIINRAIRNLLDLKRLNK